MTFSERARRYAEGVVSRIIPACEYVRQACQRQLDELASPPAGYRFDEVKADRACAFVELCPHIKGPLANRRELIRLEDWQCFILTAVFGWVDEAGNRRFRRVYIEVPRGNAKSTLSSTVALYMLALDGEAGAEVYSAATTRDQARIVFRASQAMARRMPAFCKRFGVEVTAQAIVQESTVSSFKALGRDGDTMDGLNIHLAVVDELHAHKTREVYEALESGMGKRDQPLMLIITTAGTNKHGVCYAVRDDFVKILGGAYDGAVQDFGIIYTIDKDDDPFDEATMRKANPNWGVSVDPGHVKRMAAKGQRQPSERANYLTKHLNVWVDADEALFDTNHWRRCEDAALDEAEWSDAECVVALDLASKIDVAAKVALYRRKVNGVWHYAAFPVFWVPRAAIEEERHPMYRGWEMQGDLQATSGETIDFAVIEDELKAELPGRTIKALAVDPWQAQQMIQNLQSDGLPAKEMRQTVANMSEATKTLDALMREGRIRHPGNAVLNWMIGNVVGHYDAKDNVFPRKELPQNKIDGAVALIMALAAFIQDEPKVAPSYQMLFA